MEETGEMKAPNDLQLDQWLPMKPYVPKTREEQGIPVVADMDEEERREWMARLEEEERQLARAREEQPASAADPFAGFEGFGGDAFDAGGFGEDPFEADGLGGDEPLGAGGAEEEDVLDRRFSFGNRKRRSSSPVSDIIPLRRRRPSSDEWRAPAEEEEPRTVSPERRSPFPADEEPPRRRTPSPVQWRAPAEEEEIFRPVADGREAIFEALPSPPPRNRRSPRPSPSARSSSRSRSPLRMRTPSPSPVRTPSPPPPPSHHQRVFFLSKPFPIKILAGYGSG